MGGVALGVMVNGSGLDDLGYCQIPSGTPQSWTCLWKFPPHTRRPAGGSLLLFESLPNVGVSS